MTTEETFAELDALNLGEEFWYATIAKKAWSCSLR